MDLNSISNFFSNVKQKTIKAAECVETIGSEIKEVVEAVAAPITESIKDSLSISDTSKNNKAESISSVADKARAQGTAPKLTGSFLQLSGGDNDQPIEHWAQMLGDMKKAGMDTAVVQYNSYGDTDLSEATDKILQTADKLGMKVMIGTCLSESGWYTNKYSASFLKEEGAKAADYTREMVKKFKDHESFTGVYIPYEENGMGDPEDIGDFYGQISKAAKEEKPGLTTMISPYTNIIPGVAASMPSSVIEDRFSRMLSRANVDILAWQDGVGGTTKQLDRIQHDIVPLQKACQANGVELWSDVEGFHRTTEVYQDFSAQATSMETLEKQLESQAPYVSKIISFDFNHYMDPSGSADQAKLYNDYQNYVKELDNQ